jgi:hypothetical protein
MKLFFFVFHKYFFSSFDFLAKRCRPPGRRGGKKSLNQQGKFHICLKKRKYQLYII